MLNSSTNVYQAPSSLVNVNEEISEKDERGSPSNIIMTVKQSGAFTSENNQTKSAAKGQKETSNLETMMHMIKANIGSGVLAMPLAFKNAGLIWGGISLWIMAVICVHCMHILLRCYRHVTDSSLQRSNETEGNKAPAHVGYDDVVELIVRGKCNVNSKVPVYARVLTSTLLVFGQIGGCCVYLVFVPSNLMQVIDYYHPNNSLNVQLVMCMVVVPLIPFCMIKNLKLLAPFSAVANALMICSMIVIMVELFFFGSFLKLSQLDMVADYSTWPLFYSSALYAFEGIALILPVYHKMQQKRDFAPWNGVLNTAMTLVAVMYFSMGFFGYLKYGRLVEPSITLSLPVSNVVFQVVKVLFAVAIFITYNLQFYVAAEIIWSYIFRASVYIQTLHSQVESECNLSLIAGIRISAGTKLTILQNTFRALLVTGTFLLAIAVPRIDLFISLVGAVASSMLAVIIPALLDMVQFWHLSKHRNIKLVKNIILLLIGAYIFVNGTYLSIRNIVDSFM